MAKRLFDECRRRLLTEREKRLDLLRAAQPSLTARISGDDADVATAIERQEVAVVRCERVHRELREIDAAMDRLGNGTYGVCEETEEPIEKERLLLIPWTRLSVGGALMREQEERLRGVG